MRRIAQSPKRLDVLLIEPQLETEDFKTDRKLGIKPPCNVIVYEGDEAGKSVVATIDAKTMLSVVGDNATLDAASEVNEELKRVVAQL